MDYCRSICQRKRWKTRAIQVGKVSIGGDNPIRIQSMTTSSTRDVKATVDQILRLSDEGCEMARVTVQGKKEAEACEQIRNDLVRLGCSTPLIADIHFYPPAAMLVAEFVDKVRINPGNYLDKRASFRQIDYSDEAYHLEIERIREGFSPLVEKCKSRGIAMRIGTNHGSLSDRIMSRYGDTPKGMVESAFEFANICRELDYHNFLFSMKASNPLVMVQAYRLLVSEMIKRGWNYPLHLGVTEAGSGKDGRIKSAVGIGSLLLDGLGDTIRCSITEDPWKEIDPCKRLLSFINSYQKESSIEPFEETIRDYMKIGKRPLISTGKPLHPNGSVILFSKAEDLLQKDFFESLGCSRQFGRPVKEENSVDAILLEKEIDDRILSICQALERAGIAVLTPQNLQGGVLIVDGDNKSWEKLCQKNPRYILLKLSNQKAHRGRKFFEWLKTSKWSEVPVILYFEYFQRPSKDVVIYSAAEFGSLLSDSIGEGICLAADMELKKKVDLSFGILQASRMRSSKTEFIGCPGCGRTLFDLQAVTEIIKAKTGHLPGVKIAIMGCIVNGPGEMADADFGYVGSRPGKVDLYIGKVCIEKNINSEEAPERLVELIKKHGRWIEPKQEKKAQAEKAIEQAVF